MTAPSLRDNIRFPLRTAGFVGLTFGMYGLLELDCARSPASEREPLLHAWMHRYGRALVSLYGVEVRAGGAYVGAGAQYPGADARGRGRLFVMNHRSGLDILITLALFECTILSRADLSRWPVIGMAARRAGVLFVDRSDKRSGAASIQAMASALEQGRGVMVYPEGTTFAGDEVRPFRPGAFKAAHRAGAEIVPVGIAYAGAESAYGDENFLDHMKRVSRTRRTLAAIEVGEPISPLGGSAGTSPAAPPNPLAPGDQDEDALRSAAQEAVQALVRRARTRVEQP